MSLSKAHFQQLHALNEEMHRHTAAYIHSQPLVEMQADLPAGERVHPLQFFYDIKDILFIAALRHASVLMTGDTDRGKTLLAKLVMNALLGKEEEGWHRLDVDTDFGSDTYADKDFGVMLKGEKLSERFYTAQGFLSLPGFIADEINRTHGKIGNKLIHFFDRDISLPDGSRIKTGYRLPSGETYQFQIAAINEGEEFTGTFRVDKALRRRTIIEIPFGVFPMTDEDRKKNRSSLEDIVLPQTTSRLQEILQLMESLSTLEVDNFADLFQGYLEAFDYCKHSFAGTKGAFPLRGGSLEHVCAKPVLLSEREVPVACAYLRTFSNNLCPNVQGISAGISKNLLRVAQGFAAVRATKFVTLMAGFLRGQHHEPLQYAISAPGEFTASLQRYTGTSAAGSWSEGKELAGRAIDKYLGTLQVEACDVEAALPFVGYHKIGLSEPWVTKHFSGSRYHALKYFLAEAKKKLKDDYEKPELQREISAAEAGDESALRSLAGSLSVSNPWLWKALRPFFTQRKTTETSSDARAGVADGDAQSISEQALYLYEK